MRKLLITLALVTPFAAMAGEKPSHPIHVPNGNAWGWNNNHGSLGCKYADYQRKPIEYPIGLAGLVAVGWIVRRKHNAAK